MRTTIGWIVCVAVSAALAYDGAQRYAAPLNLDPVVLAVIGTAINTLTLSTLLGLATGRLR